LDSEIRITSIRETSTSNGAATTTKAQMMPVDADAASMVVAPSSSQGINLSYSSLTRGHPAYSPGTPA
jgi:hypothetical protein